MGQEVNTKIAVEVAWKKTIEKVVQMYFWSVILFSATLRSLRGSLQGKITYREIPVVITGNRYAEYNFCLFWLHNFPVLLTFNLLL